MPKPTPARPAVKPPEARDVDFEGGDFVPPGRSRRRYRVVPRPWTGRDAPFDDDCGFEVREEWWPEEPEPPASVAPAPGSPAEKLDILVATGLLVGLQLRSLEADRKLMGRVLAWKQLLREDLFPKWIVETRFRREIFDPVDALARGAQALAVQDLAQDPVQIAQRKPAGSRRAKP